VEQPADASALGPLCHEFDGDAAGDYTEYESPDGLNGIAILDFEGSAEALANLETMYRSLDDCSEDSLTIMQQSSTDRTVVWQASVGTGGSALDAQRLGFARDGLRGRVVIATGPLAESIVDELLEEV
jgi:hypothetical protein